VAEQIAALDKTLADHKAWSANLPHRASLQHWTSAE
jgi:hypothetical protein